MTRASKPLPVLAMTAPMILLAGLVFAAPDARAADKEVITAKLVACPSDKTVIGGVNACGKIWKLRSGNAELYQGGKLEVALDGLVLNDPSVGNANGSPDGVDAVA